MNTKIRETRNEVNIKIEIEIKDSRDSKHTMDRVERERKSWQSRESTEKLRRIKRAGTNIEIIATVERVETADGVESREQPI